MIESVVVLGGGSAGLIAAVTLRRVLPDLPVVVLRSSEIGVIGVGEGTTPYFGTHFFKNLGLHPKKFYQQAQPTWKLGIRFKWGRAGDFSYPFTPELSRKPDALPRYPGFFAGDEPTFFGMGTACMHHERAFPRRRDGMPDLSLGHAYHIENEKLVGWLESTARSLGVRFVEGKVAEVDHGDDRVDALVLEDGQRIEGDLFIDASGFRSEILSKAFDEPWIDYSGSLFCERAVIGGWERTDETIHPYTTAETMDAGWCWQIEHEHWINRGYVYSPSFISDDEALAEFMAKNPKVSNEPRVVRFRSGRTRRSWVGNVVAVGNASGFVEPLEATALHNICYQSRGVAATLLDSACRPSESMVELYNRGNANAWDNIRDFLAVHYAFNDLLDTPFWQACRNDTDLGAAEAFVRYYRDNGPTTSSCGPLMPSENSFGMEGYLSMFLGQRLDHARSYQPDDKELKAWQRYQSELAKRAKSGFTVAQTLELMRSPRWKWM